MIQDLTFEIKKIGVWTNDILKQTLNNDSPSKEGKIDSTPDNMEAWKQAPETQTERTTGTTGHSTH